MKKKRLTALAMAMTFAASTLAGCSGSGSTATTAAASGDSTTAAASGDSAAADGDTVKIGVTSPNTGTLAAYGESITNAIRLAVDEINADGGVLDGKQLELISYDDKGDSTEGANAFNKLVGEGVCAVIGSATSGVTAALVPLADEAGVTLLAPTATADSLDDSDDYVFRACFKDSFQGKMVAKFAAENLGVKKVAILYASGDAYSAGLNESFTAACEEYGLDLVASESSSTTDDTEFSSQLTSIIAMDPELIFAPYYYNTVGP